MAADTIMGFPLTTMRYFLTVDFGPYPNLRAYLQRIGTRNAAHRRAMAKGDPGMQPLLTGACEPATCLLMPSWRIRAGSRPRSWAGTPAPPGSS